jgi:predicted kinase
MTERESLQLPLLVVVTGRPASGKTTLAHALARAIRCPLLSRDEIKEGFINTLRDSQDPDVDTNLHVYTTFFKTIEFLLSKHITLVAEAAFQHQVWQPQLDKLQTIARICLIHCALDPQVAKSRCIQRSAGDVDRGQYHDDFSTPASQAAIERLIDNYEPPRIDAPMLTVDTSAEYQPPFEEIVSFVRA